MISETIHTLAEIAVIVQPGALYLTLVGFKKTAVDRSQDQTVQKIMQSILFLERFEVEWRQKVEVVNRRYDEEKEELMQHALQQLKKRVAVDEAEQIVRKKLLSDLRIELQFNRLEVFSMDINYQIVDKEQVWPMIGSDVTDFVNRYKDYLESFLSNRRSYKNIMKLMNDQNKTEEKHNDD